LGAGVGCRREAVVMVERPRRGFMKRGEGRRRGRKKEEEGRVKNLKEDVVNEIFAKQLWF